MRIDILNRLGVFHGCDRWTKPLNDAR